jgi:flagellar basal-body rod modification protein FlgD
MMISTTGSGTSGTTGTTSGSQLERSQLGRDQFLTLLVTQLRNQDPLSPMQPYEFAAQLAQFSSVEQLTQLNDEMAHQSDSVDLATLIGKTNFGAGLLGRKVLAEGNQVTVTSSGPGSVKIDVGTGGGKGKLVVKDSTGHEVATRELGTLEAGRQTVTLPTDLAPGAYTYEVTVTGAQDASVPVTTYTEGIVDGVSFKNGQIMLRIGGRDVQLESVAEIESAT